MQNPTEITGGYHFVEWHNIAVATLGILGGVLGFTLKYVVGKISRDIDLLRDTIKIAIEGSEKHYDYEIAELRKELDESKHDRRISRDIDLLRDTIKIAIEGSEKHYDYEIAELRKELDESKHDRKILMREIVALKAEHDTIMKQYCKHFIENET